MKASACALRHMKVKERYIQDALSTCLPPRGRLENIEKGQLYLVLIDYAHTPDALENVLNTVKKISLKRKGSLYVLFGCGGDRDRGKRPKMGKIASQIADYMVITDDNPRSENSQDIITEIVEGVSSKSKNHIVIQDRKKAIGFIINKAKNKDVVILVGKGHETYQVLKTETLFFDDREEAREAILRRLKNKNER
eukprot:COSAG01_NODE_313_length_19043_cov_3.917177_19_plen_195_part_00